jgi:hypothetical protein
MRADLLLYPIESFIKRRWRLIAGLFLAGVAVWVATSLSDDQGRADIPSGYAVRMTCEKDPESYLWSGGCERIAADIARKGRPSFGELYRAFVTAHHRAIPSPATRRRFARKPCETGFDIRDALRGTRFVLSPEAFKGVCSSAYTKAIENEIDARDRALLVIERGELSWPPLVAGTLANLSEPLVLLAAAFVILALWIL